MSFKVFHTEVVISYALLCTAAICLIFGAFSGFLLCFFSVIIHETGHLVPIIIFGSPPDRIKISLFEISIVDRFRQSRTVFCNTVIIFSGPLANFICFLLFYLLYLLCGGVFLNFAVVNLFTGIFNMLPAMSLDGGQLLYILICRKKSPNSARGIIGALTLLILIPLSFCGFMLLFGTRHNFTLLGVCAYLALSLVCGKNNF